MFRRSVLFVALFAVLIPATAYSQDDDGWDSESEVEVWQPTTTLEMEAHLAVSTELVRPEIGLMTTHSISEGGGVWLFAAGTTWAAQTYGGFMITPGDCCMFGLGLGLETEPNHWRVALVLDVNTHGFHLAGVYENGASGRWHHLRATYQIDDNFLIGVMSQRFEGEGFLVGAVIDDFLEIRLAYLYDTEMYLNERRADADTAWWNVQYWTAMISVGIKILPLP